MTLLRPAVSIGTMRKLISILLLAAPMLGGCFDPLCGNKLVASASEPGGRHTAYVFQRDCGATTDVSTQISIMKGRAKPSRSGNAFISDGNSVAARSAPWGGPWAELSWRSPGHLLIRYDKASRVFQQNQSVAGVAVTYEAVSRP